MARRPPNYLDTIEYIGPRPRKEPKKPNFLGGWVVLLIAAAGAYFFGQQFLMPLVRAEQTDPSSERADLLIAELQPSASFGERLAAAALQRTQAQVSYEDAYYVIDFPNGDIPSNKGKAEDLVVRSFRALGVDLQQRLHEDMKADFREYPQIFGNKSPDPNIDHRHTANLQRYFRRQGAEQLVRDEQGLEKPSQDKIDYQPGDVVAWRLNGGRCHIGIVVPGPGDRRDDAWVVHNIGSGPVWEDALTDFKIIGHYRYGSGQAAY